MSHKARRTNNKGRHHQDAWIATDLSKDFHFLNSFSAVLKLERTQ